MKIPRILLVDDKIENIKLAGIVLSQHGFQLNTARNGQMALKICQTTPPDLILLDIKMPEMDGFECCIRIKQIPGLKDTPVIFLTADRESFDIVKGFEAGAVDYIFKPFDTAELLSRINTHLALRNAHLKLEELTRKASCYISPHLYQAIFTGEKDTVLETTRKPLTIFFSDIVNFTETTESMGDKDLTQWLNNYCHRMAELVFKHGGTLDKFIGDCVMVFFGDPKSKGEQEDACSCILMALEMLQEAHNMGIKIRIGINSGPAYVGNFGMEKQMNYTVIGSSVILASRLESACEPGKLLISESTHQLIKDSFWCEENGSVQCKGYANEVMSYWVNA